MAVELANAYVNIVPETSKVGSAVKTMTGQIGDAGKRGGGLFSAGLIGGIAGGLASMAGTAIAGALGGVKDTVVSMVNAYSDLEDATGAASVVFGDSMDVIIEQSKAAASSMGMTRAQVIDAANTFGTFGKAAGLTGQDLAAFSTQMTSLAGDLSSFKGGSPEEAIEAIGAAMRGEAEPIRRYGILLDDATLKNRALEMGLISSTKEALTPQAKTLAAQAEILAQSTDAMGDFARTSDSTANVAKRFDATLTNFKTTLGSAIAPAFTLVKGAAADAMAGLDASLQAAQPAIESFWAGTTQKFTAGVTGLKGILSILKDGDFLGSQATFGLQEDSALVTILFTIREKAAAGIDALKGVFATIGPMIEQVLATIGPVIASLAPQVLQLASAFSPVGMAMKVLSPILPAVADALSQVGAALSGALASVLPTVSDLLQTLATTLSGTLASVLPTITELLTLLAQTLAGSLAAVLPTVVSVFTTLVGAVSQVLPALMPLVQTLAGAFIGVLEKILPALAPIISQLSGPLVTVLTSLVPPIAQIVTTLIDALIPVFDALTPVIGVVIDVVSQLITAIVPLLPPVLQVVQVLADALVPLLPTIGDLIATVVTVLAGLFQALSPILPVITDLIGTGLNVLVTVLTPLINVIALVADVLMTGLTAALDLLVPPVTAVIGVVTSFASLLSGVVTGVINTFLALIQGAFKRVWDITRTVWNAISTTITTVTGAIGGTISNLASRAISTISGLGSRLRDIFLSAWHAMRNAAANGVSGITNLIRNLPSQALSALGSLGSYLTQSGWSLIEGFKRGILNAFSSVKNAVSRGLSAVRNLFPFSPAKEGPFSGRGWVLYSGLSIGEAMGDGIRRSTPDVAKAATNLAAAARPKIDLAKTTRSLDASLRLNTPTGAAHTLQGNAPVTNVTVIQNNPVARRDSALRDDVASGIALAAAV